MIDIVGVFDSKITQWNLESKCGYCWEFEAPLRLSDMNESERKSKECCVRVFLTNLEINYNRSYENGLTSDKQVQYSFDLHFMIYDDIGKNVYSEQDGHPLSESKWKTILLPLFQCITDSFDFCDILGRGLQIDRENWKPEIDYMDNNYTGWVANVTLQDTEYGC